MYSWHCVMYDVRLEAFDDFDSKLQCQCFPWPLASPWLMHVFRHTMNASASVISSSNWPISIHHYQNVINFEINTNLYIADNVSGERKCISFCLLRRALNLQLKAYELPIHYFFQSHLKCFFFILSSKRIVFHQFDQWFYSKFFLFFLHNFVVAKEIIFLVFT